MKTIKVFLASSEELKDEREKFGNLIRRLDDIYLKRGIHVQLLVWEDMDPCYNNVRKQDEYNMWIRGSHFFVCLFYTKAGQYTMEELDVARTESARRKEPKIMIYCRDLQDGDVEMADLADFKRTLDNKLRHFWGHYSTTDKLHLDFVLFFMRTEEGNTDVLKLENGEVMFDDLRIAKMENLPFASENEGYKDMQQRLHALSVEVNRLWDAVQQAPGIELLRSMHQQKLDEYNALKDKFAGHQQALFDTAKRISEMQLENISNELQRAIDEFLAGRIEAANAILDGIEHEADRREDMLDINRALVHQDLEALMLRIKTIKADISIPIEIRKQLILEKYKKADRKAEKSAFPQEKYAILLRNYGETLYAYALYDEAMEVFQRVLRMNKDIYGFYHHETAVSYYNIGRVHNTRGNDNYALKYDKNVLKINKKLFGDNHPETALSYSNIGMVYYNSGECGLALEVFKIALKIRKEVLGTEHPYTAESYNNVGDTYYKMKDYPNALCYYKDALKIFLNKLGIENRNTAKCYESIGEVYMILGNYDQALEYQNKAFDCFLRTLAFKEKKFGTFNLDTALSYNNLGLVYQSQGDYPKALEYYFKALVIREKFLGQEHPDIAISYNNIGLVHDSQGDYPKALEYHFKALAILEKLLGLEHPYTQTVWNNIEIIKSKMDSQD